MDDVRQYGEADQLTVVPVAFETEYVTRKVDGKDAQVARDSVLLGRIGDAQYRQFYWIDRLSGEKSDSPAIWEAIKPAYENWKKGEQMVMEGTPLAALAFIPKRAVEAYRMLNIHTAETLARIEDGDLPKMGLDARNHRDMARKYVETQNSDSTKFAAKAKEQDDTIAELKRQIEEMRAAMKPPKVEKKAA